MYVRMSAGKGAFPIQEYFSLRYSITVLYGVGIAYKLPISIYIYHFFFFFFFFFHFSPHKFIYVECCNQLQLGDIIFESIVGYSNSHDF